MTEGQGSPGQPGAPDLGASETIAAPGPPPAPDAAARPLIERLGLASIAIVIAILFGGVALASWLGGEPFLAVMAAIGALMTAWAGAITLTRG